MSSRPCPLRRQHEFFDGAESVAHPLGVNTVLPYPRPEHLGKSKIDGAMHCSADPEDASVCVSRGVRQVLTASRTT